MLGVGFATRADSFIPVLGVALPPQVAKLHPTQNACELPQAVRSQEECDLKSYEQQAQEIIYH